VRGKLFGVTETGSGNVGNSPVSPLRRARKSVETNPPAKIQTHGSLGNQGYSGGMRFLLHPKTKRKQCHTRPNLPRFADIGTIFGPIGSSSSGVWRKQTHRTPGSFGRRHRTDPLARSGSACKSAAIFDRFHRGKTKPIASSVLPTLTSPVACQRRQSRFRYIPCARGPANRVFSGPGPISEPGTPST